MEIKKVVLEADSLILGGGLDGFNAAIGTAKAGGVHVKRCVNRIRRRASR